MGVSERFRPLPAEDVSDFRRRMGLPPRFLLYVGTLEPRKNLPHLLRAYAEWQARSTAGRDAALVLAGAKGWHYREIFELAAELGLTGPTASAPLEQGGRVHFPGYVPEEDLCLWYNVADAFVYPSLFEGFGLPLLEAMASGTPVICSDAPSLQEVAADAALIVPAQDRPGPGKPHSSASSPSRAWPPNYGPAASARQAASPGNGPRQRRSMYTSPHCTAANEQLPY